MFRVADRSSRSVLSKGRRAEVIRRQLPKSIQLPWLRPVLELQETEERVISYVEYVYNISYFRYFSVLKYFLKAAQMETGMV